MSLSYIKPEQQNSKHTYTSRYGHVLQCPIAAGDANGNNDVLSALVIPPVEALEPIGC